MAIVRADPSFDVEHFVVGARAAYELIVNAFAKGDREALRALLTPRVYDSYAAAITAREAEGRAGPRTGAPEERPRSSKHARMATWRA